MEWRMNNSPDEMRRGQSKTVTESRLYSATHLGVDTYTSNVTLHSDLLQTQPSSQPPQDSLPAIAQPKQVTPVENTHQSQANQILLQLVSTFKPVNMSQIDNCEMPLKNEMLFQRIVRKILKYNTSVDNLKAVVDVQESPG